MKSAWMTAIALTGSLLVTSTASAKPTSNDSPQLKPFAQCAEVRDYVAIAYARQVASRLAQPDVQYRYGRPMPDASVAKSAPATRAQAQGSSAFGGPSSYTKTNVQVQGVDENDTVKTDGRYTYTVSGRSVTVTRIWPVKETRVVAHLELGEHVTGQSLFLNGDRLVVFGSVYEPGEATGAVHRGRPAYAYRPPKFQGTRMLVVDVSSPDEPRIERAEDFEGRMSQARMIGSDVYFVSHTWLQAPSAIWDLGRYDVERPKTWLQGDRYQKRVERLEPVVRKQMRKILDNVPTKRLLPSRRIVRPDGRVVSVRQGVSCSDVYRASIPSTQLINVAHVNLDRPDDRGNAALFGEGWQIYASHENLYVAGTTYGWSWWGGRTNPDDWYKTTIHKFALRGDDGQPQYRASGNVDGWLLNQFSMDEFDGHFRIATTDWNIPGRTGRSGNHLTVLAEKGGELVETGAIRDLAPGERIYSMRMMGEVGYMVTFRQTDPLFTMDLSDPENPQVLGELKINGFSSYIHPLGMNHLLTVGQDADDDGRIRGLHLQIFDVSDLENPTRVHHKRITDERWSSWSPAMWDHHAFTFDAARNLLVLPVTSHHPEPYSGALVLRADPHEGFHEYGFLSQNGKTGQQWCNDVWGAERETSYGRCNPQSVHWYTAVNRSIIVDDYIVAIGHLGLTVHPWRRPGRTIASARLARARDYRPRQW